MDPLDDAESSRNKFVYGNVVLRPTLHNSDQLDQQGSGSLSALRQLNDQNIESVRPPSPLSRHQHNQQQVQPAATTSETYGRILVSPPSLPNSHHSKGDTFYQQQQQQHHISQQQQQRQHHSSQPDLRSPRHWSKSTLDKLKQQLEPHQFDVGVGSVGDTVTSADTDELGRQQHGDSFAVAPPDQATDGASDEFEGYWHSSPLEQIEVRHARSNSGISSMDAHQTIAPTKSNSRDIFVVD